MKCYDCGATEDLEFQPIAQLLMVPLCRKCRGLDERKPEKKKLSVWAYLLSVLIIFAFLVLWITFIAA
jgi:hypothetical protein